MACSDSPDQEGSDSGENTAGESRVSVITRGKKMTREDMCQVCAMAPVSSACLKPVSGL